jgi:hypothetical protein
MEWNGEGKKRRYRQLSVYTLIDNKITMLAALSSHELYYFFFSIWTKQTDQLLRERERERERE